MTDEREDIYRNALEDLRIGRGSIIEVVNKYSKDFDEFFSGLAEYAQRENKMMEERNSEH